MALLNEIDEFASTPSWCAEMGMIIDFEVLAERLGLSMSEAFRLALDEHLAVKAEEKRQKELSTL